MKNYNSLIKGKPIIWNNSLLIQNKVNIQIDSIPYFTLLFQCKKTIYSHFHSTLPTQDIYLGFLIHSEK